jgi:1,4-alpha-glucan branching enzyme
MHDTLNYFKNNPIFRQYHQGEITFSIIYAFSENFMLPFSHDEVVHGKGPLIDRMPGDDWQRFANLRTMYAYMFTHPGTKLLFMGGEFGQSSEWHHDHELEWSLLKYSAHQGVSKLVKDLNKLYKSEPALYERSFDASGFEWIEHGDYKNSVVSYIRKGEKAEEYLIVACNFTPIPRVNYRLGIFECSHVVEILNTDANEYWGSNFNTEKTVKVQEDEANGRKHSIVVSLPPLSVMVWKAKKK